MASQVIAPNRIRMIPSGNVASDTAEFKALATKLAAVDGDLVINGTLTINDKHSWAGGLSLIGENNAKIVSQDIGGGVLLWWNPGVTVDALEGSSFTASLAKGSNTIASVGHSVQRGDWFWIAANSIVPGVSPHYGTGAGQHPLELHNCTEVIDVDTFRIEGFAIDDFSSLANSRAAVVPMTTGVVVENIAFDFDSSLLPPPEDGSVDFSSCLRFNACLGPVVAPSVQFLRNAPGDCRFSLCANVSAEGDWLGSFAQDFNYAYQVDGCNGVYINTVVHGTRHPCDTTASKQSDNFPGVAATGISSDRIQITAHGFSNADHLFFTNVGSTNLIEKTHYWVVNAGTNDFQVALTPGGSPVSLNSGTPTVFLRSRWGTPLGVRVRGVHYSSPKVLTAGGTEERSGPNTHQEGYGVDISMDCYVYGREETNYACNARARATRFHDMRIFGGNPTGDLNIAGGIRLAASECIADNVIVQNVWKPIQIQKWATDQTEPISDVHVDVKAIDCPGPVVSVQYGDDTRVKVDAKRCSDRSGNSPFSDKSIIEYKDDAGTGHQIKGGDLSKASNNWAIDLGQLANTDIEISGVDLSGYGSGEPGIGRKIDISSIDAGTDTFTCSRTHGLVVDNRVEFITTGTFPTGISGSVKYWVVAVPSTTELRVSTTQGGSPVDISGSFTPVLSVVSPYYNEVRSAVSGVNFIDS